MFLSGPRTIWKESRVYLQLLMLYNWPEQSDSTAAQQTSLLAEKRVQQFFPILGCGTSQRNQIREITWTENSPHFLNLLLTSSFASKTKVWSSGGCKEFTFLSSKWLCWFIWKATLPTCNSVFNCLTSPNSLTAIPWAYCTSPGCVPWVSVATHTASRW